MIVKVKDQMICVERTPLVSDTENIYECQFEFEGWEGYTKTACFRYKDNDYQLLLTGDTCRVPFEVIADSGVFQIGVFGTNGDKVYPTVWSDYIRVLEGCVTDGTEPAPPPTPSVYEQILEELENRVEEAPIDGTQYGRKNGKWSVISGGGGGGSSDYADLDNKPKVNNVELVGNKSLRDLGITIPTKTSELSNDSGFLTSHQSLANYYTKTEVDGYVGSKQDKITSANKLPYSLLSGTPTIPTKTSELTNDSGFLTSHQDISGKADKTYVDAEIARVEDEIPSLTGYATQTYVDGKVSPIESKIPSQASSSNQLADKAFVNSSIATNTAYFCGTFNSVAELEAYSGEKTNNDYAFVKIMDEVVTTEVKAYDRYKYNGTSWVFEYELNNSSFTAEQWSAINSGITSGLVALINTALQPSAITDMATKTWVEGKGYGTYTKPSGGIPASDLAQTYYLASNPNGYTDDTVANSKYTKPSDGIPKTDLASAVQTSLDNADTSIQQKGKITSSTVLEDLKPGFYTVDGIRHNTFPNKNENYYGGLIVFSGTYKGQLLCAGISGVSGLYARRYLTASSSWTAWQSATPSYTSADEGKVLKIVNGTPTWTNS